MAYDPQPSVRQVKLPEGTQPAVAINEQLDQLFAAQCATVYLLGQILAAMRGQAAPLPGEEVDPLIAEFIDTRNKWQNINQ